MQRLKVINVFLIFYVVPLDSLKAICERFGIPENTGSKEIRGELKALIRKNHPDVTGGEFTSSEQEATYHAAREAAEFIDSSPEQGLASMSASSPEQLELVQSRVQTILENQESFELILQELQTKLEDNTEKSEQDLRRESASSRISELETNTNRYIDSKVKEAHLKAYIPVVTFTALSVIFAVLLFLPQRIGDNQTLQQLIDVQSSLFIWLWLTSFVLVAAVWLTAWYLESRYRRSYETLKRNDYQEDLFKRFTKFMRNFPSAAINQIGFSTSDLTKFIYASLRPKSSTFQLLWLQESKLYQYSKIESLTQKAEVAKRKYDEAAQNIKDAKQELKTLESAKKAIASNSEELPIPDSEEDKRNKINEQMHEVARDIKNNERVQRDESKALRIIFEEFKAIPLKVPLFPQLASILDPEVAEQLAEIILQKALLRSGLEEQTRPNSIDDWFI